MSYILLVKICHWLFKVNSEVLKVLRLLNEATNLCTNWPAPYSRRATIYFELLGDISKACEDAEWACKLGMCEALMEFREKGYCE